MTDHEHTHDHDHGETPPEDFKGHRIATVDYDFEGDYDAAVRYLDDNFAYFLTAVLNIGEPRLTSAIPTAAVTVAEVSKNVKRDFEFIFNAGFAEKLSTEELAFILSHETMHVLLNHLQMVRKVKRFQEDTMRWNIAADCVINDYLTSQMGLIPPEGVCRGEDIVGYNCANATVSDVFQDVKPTPKLKQCDKCQGSGKQECGGCGGSGEQKDGSGGKEKCDGCGGGGEEACDGCGGMGVTGENGEQVYPGRPIDSHDWLHKATEGQGQTAEKATQGGNLPQDLERTKKDDEYKSGMNPGVGVGGAQGFSELKGVGLKWAELLKKVNPFIYNKGPRPRPAWHKRPRKMGAFPDVILPVKKKGLFDEGGEKPAIVMALDTSGSIGYEDSNEFVNMARSIPQDKIKLFVCTFTTAYQELDLDDPQWNSGGTAFDPISDYIEDIVKPKNRKKYPKAVVVITDGYATFHNKRPSKDEGKGWYWLLTESGVPNYGDALPGEIGHLIDYRKGK